MKNRFLNFSLFVAIVFVVISCKQQPSSSTISKTVIVLDSLKLKCYADTIVCDMIVRNSDKEDKWMEECLGRFHHNELLDAIFEDIYNGKLIAYEYVTHKKLTIDEVRKIEKAPGYSRDVISKFLFREAWYYDRSNHTLIKRVHSIIFGYEIFDTNISDKKIIPMFKIEF
jgi:hypothetical protein